MGHVAKEGRSDERAALIEGLQRAYADEWFAHFNYHHVAHVIAGPASAALAPLLAAKADRALARAHRLAERILQLDGELPSRLTELTGHATDKPFKLPADARDTDACLRAVLDAERTSVRAGRELLGRTPADDAVTRALLIDLLAESEEGETAMERLLGRPEPALDGR